MQRYEPLVNRPIFGIAAVALTALTIAMMVVWPAGVPAAEHATMLYGSATVLPGLREVSIAPSPIEVVVERPSGLEVARTAGAVLPKNGRRG